MYTHTYIHTYIQTDRCSIAKKGARVRHELSLLVLGEGCRLQARAHLAQRFGALFRVWGFGPV